MSDMEEVEEAESRMNAAKDALMKYIEARESIDKEQAEFLGGISGLGE